MSGNLVNRPGRFLGTLLFLLATFGSPAWAAAAGERLGLGDLLPPLPRPVGGGGDPRGAPEIDPGLARSTVTILLGGLLILTDRRRR